ncbi:MAG TPA: hypothetical protein VHP83_24310 [Aggregatilineaceae bacterium]|nr:hypothetical protein [Aggregatilineaceae bacterium]
MLPRHAGAVSQWLKQAEEDEPEALCRQPRKITMPRLTAETGAEIFRFQGEVNPPTQADS